MYDLLGFLFKFLIFDFLCLDLLAKYELKIKMLKSLRMERKDYFTVQV